MADEKLLISRVLAGEEEAFSDLVKQYHNGMLRVASAIVGSAENIEALRQMGVLFIDVTDTPEVSVLGHSKFTRSPALLSIIASGALSERIVAGAPGQDILIDGLNLTGQAALAVAYLPYTVGGTLTGGL